MEEAREAEEGEATNEAETSTATNAQQVEDTSEKNGEEAKVQDAEQNVPSSDELLLKVQSDLKEANERHLRLNAEFENFKKRTAKETQDRLKYYYTDLVKELLPSIDNLERAIEHSQKENASIDAMLEGIQMVHKGFIEGLEKFGITPIEAANKVFDPTLHQAVGIVESDEVPENHVMDVYQKGYQLHERVVRPAMVRVSKKS